MGSPRDNQAEKRQSSSYPSTTTPAWEIRNRKEKGKKKRGGSTRSSYTTDGLGGVVLSESDNDSGNESDGEVYHDASDQVKDIYPDDITGVFIYEEASDQTSNFPPININSAPSSTENPVTETTPLNTKTAAKEDNTDTKEAGGSLLGKVWGVVKTVLFGGLTFFAASTPALSAFVARVHKSPADIGTALWNQMNKDTKGWSVADAVSSFAINFIMNTIIIPTGMGKFKVTMIEAYHGGWKDRAKASVYILFSFGATCAAGAIAYSTYLFLPGTVITAIFPSAISSIVTFALSYTGVKNLFTAILNRFNKDIQNQAATAEKLYLLELNVKYRHQNELRTVEQDFELLKKQIFGTHLDAPMTEKQRKILHKKALDHYTTLVKNHPKILRKKLTAEYIQKHAFLFFDVSFALLYLGTPAYFTFMKAGFDGVNLLTGNNISHIDPWSKRVIGFIPGLARASFYFDSGLNARTTGYDLIVYLYRNPKWTPVALLLLFMNFLSSSGPENVAFNAIAKPDNIIGIDKTKMPMLASTFVMLNKLGGFVVNSNSSINKFFLSTLPTPNQYTLDDMIDYLERVNVNTASPSVAKKFKFFLDACEQKTQIPQTDAEAISTLGNTTDIENPLFTDLDENSGLLSRKNKNQ